MFKACWLHIMHIGHFSHLTPELLARKMVLILMDMDILLSFWRVYRPINHILNVNDSIFSKRKKINEHFKRPSKKQIFRVVYVCVFVVSMCGCGCAYLCEKESVHAVDSFPINNVHLHALPSCIYL